MSVHYKFKSALDFDTITFDGLHINVADLKKAIVHQKRLGKTTDFDLQITNAQTKEVYSEDNTLIPKNTSLIIARVPLAQTGKKNFVNNAEAPERTMAAPRGAMVEAGEVDLSKMTGSEEDKINAMMAQSTIDYDPTNYQKVRGGQIGEVPPNYRCHRCHKPGHWIKNCPLGPIPKDHHIKRNTGIPRSFLERDENQEAESTIPKPVPEPKVEIPEDLICSICKDLFVDAVMIPCCGSSFCDECVRTALLDSEDNECPDCFEKGTSPSSLIPNRFLRTSVNNFKSETGYIAPRKPPPRKVVEQVEADSKEKVEPDTTTTLKVDDGASPDDEIKERRDKSPPSRQLSDEEQTIRRVGEDQHKHDDDYDRHRRSPESIGNRTPLDQDENSYSEPISNIVGVTNQIQPIEDPHYMQNQPIRRIENLPPMQVGYGPPPQQGQMGYPPMQNNMMGGPPMYGNMRMPGPGYHMMRPYEHNMYGHQPRFNRYPGPHMYRPRPPMVPNVRQIYQEVQQTVGTGIIDDPLEAFNRIMREKEKKKATNRRSPPPFIRDRRSRSKESDLRRRRRSRSFERDTRPIRGRGSPDRDRIRKKRRSRSRNSRSPKSYSRSRSRSPRKFSPSPKRRSRSPDKINSPAKHSKRYEPKRTDERSQRNDRRDRSPVRNESRHRPSQRDEPRSRPRTPPRSAPRSQPIPVYPPAEAFPPEFGMLDNYTTPYAVPTSENTILPDTTGVDPKYNKIDEAPPGTVELPPPGVDTIERESWKTDQYSAPELATDRRGAALSGGTKDKDKRKRNDSTHTPERKSTRDEVKSKEKHSRDTKHSKEEKHSRDKDKDKDKEKDKKADKKEKKKHSKEKKEKKKHKRDKSDKEKDKKSHPVSAKTSPEKTSPETSHQTPELVPEVDQSTTDHDPKSESEQVVDRKLDTPGPTDEENNFMEPFEEAERDNSFELAEQQPLDNETVEINLGNDAILDLYDNIDLDVSTEISKDFGMTEDEFLQLPEPSKWEKDEESENKPVKNVEPLPTKPDSKDPKSSDSAKVTTEVLKRAENALFTKSFVSVKPISDTSGKSKSRSKTSSPLLSTISKPESHRSHSTLKVTVGSSEERYVKKSDSPMKKRPSIKDRLGAKVSDDKRRTPESKVERKSDKGSSRRQSRSRSRTPERRRSSVEVKSKAQVQKKPLERLDGGRSIRRAIESRAVVRRSRDRDTRSPPNRRDNDRSRDSSRNERDRDRRPPVRDKSPTRGSSRSRIDKSVADKSGRDRSAADKAVTKRLSHTPDIEKSRKKLKVEEADKKSDGNSSDSSSSSSGSTDSDGHKRKKKKKKNKKKSKVKKEKKKRKHKD